jgi:hypothetical protein
MSIIQKGLIRISILIPKTKAARIKKIARKMREIYKNQQKKASYETITFERNKT